MDDSDGFGEASGRRMVGCSIPELHREDAERTEQELNSIGVGFVILERRYDSFPVVGVIERKRYEGQPTWFGSTKRSDLQMLSALGLLDRIGRAEHLIFRAGPNEILCPCCNTAVMEGFLCCPYCKALFLLQDPSSRCWMEVTILC